MSAEGQEATTNESSSELKLSGLFAFKIGMGSVYGEDGERIPVTILKYAPWVVSQVKTKEKDGYNAVQVASVPKPAKNALASEKGHLKKAGFEGGSYFVKELASDSVETAQVGMQISINSVSKGDVVALTGVSKGRGFAGVIKRHGHHGGPGAHGSKFHRRPGSMGNRTWPGRVKPGRKLPGHYGSETVTLKSVKVVDVLPEDSVILVRGSVPGARNSLVRLLKKS